MILDSQEYKVSKLKTGEQWPAMTNTWPVFPEPPLTAFKRQNNLRSMIIRAKVPIKPKPYIIEYQKSYWKENWYIGESGRPLKYRMDEHRGYVVNQTTSNATGAHFNSPGHSLSDMKVLIIEQVKIRMAEYRKEREKYFINKGPVHFSAKNS